MWLGVLLGGGVSETFKGSDIPNVKQHSNENVWEPKQNIQIETEIWRELLDKFINRFITRWNTENTAWRSLGPF